MTDKMSVAYREGYGSGLNAGWDEANFSEAYGGKPDADNALRARFILDDTSEDFRSGFLTGHADGVERYENGQYVDGTPIVDS